MRRTLGALTLALMPLLSTAIPARADVTDLTSGRWSGGAGVGFWLNTPDGVEFALEGHADYFWTRRFSMGPLAQYAGAGNDHIFGLSVQAKYWWAISGLRRPATLALQGGIGFVRADIQDADSGAADVSSSFLIPVGIALDYAVTRNVAVTVALLLNLTSLGERVRAGGREVDLRTDAMPAVYLGLRF